MTTKQKKGISPLIATVLLIGFTVALAAIIMTWGTTFTRNIQKSTSQSTTSNVVCAQDVVLDISGACKLAGNDYRIVVSNNGKVEVTELNVRMYKSDVEVDSYTASNVGLAKFSIKPITATATT